MLNNNTMNNETKQIDNLFSLFLFWLSMIILSFYFASNVLYFDNRRNIWLLFSLIIPFCCFMYQSISFVLKTGVDKFKISYSVFPLFFFLLYISYRILIDKNQIKLLLFYTCGCLFFYILGSIISFVIKQIDTLREKYKNTNKINFYFYIFYFSITFILYVYSFFYLLPRSRSDFFLIDKFGLYQFPGDLMILNTFLISILSIFIIKRNKTLIIFSLLYSLFVFNILLLAQFLGSNKSCVVNIGILIIFFTYYYIFYRKKYKHFYLKRNNQKKIVLSWIGNLIKKYSFIIGIIVILLFIYRNNYPRIRILNYNLPPDYNIYIFSRLFIIKNYFLSQFEINPFWGNFDADVIVGVNGYYAHSFILSILSHCGIMGAILIGLYLLLAICDFYNSIKQLNNNKETYKSLFILSLSLWIFLMANISSFFTWYPVWFAFGFCFPFLRKKENGVI